MTWLLIACTQGPDTGSPMDSDVLVDLPTWVGLPDVESLGDHGDGDILTGLIGEGESGAVIFDRAGAARWSYDNGQDNVASWTKFNDDGAVVHNHHYRDRQASKGEVLITDLDGTATSTPTPQHHHAALHVEGQLITPRVTFVEMQIEGEPSLVAMDEIVVQDVGSDEARVLFSFETDYALQPFDHCDHWDDGVYYRQALDWTHVNSLAYDEADDAVLIVARHLDLVLSIDRQTGAINWELGGLQSEWTLGPDSEAFNHPHLSEFRDDQLVLFDNGDHKDPAVSRVVVYDLDRENRVYTQVRDIPEPNGELNALMGDAQLLDSGNLLVSWSESGLIQEIAPDDSVVWSLQMPLGLVTGRVDTP